MVINHVLLAWLTDNIIGHANKINLYQVQLVPKWTTICGYAVSLCNLYSSQLSLLPLADGKAVVRKVTICLAGHASQSLWYIHLWTQWLKEERCAARVHFY